MKIGIVIEASENLAERIKDHYTRIATYNWEIKFKNLKTMEEIGVCDVVDPLVENSIEVYAIHMPPLRKNNEKMLGLIEKAAMMADELKSELVVLPIPARAKATDAIFLEKTFELISNYKLKLCFNVKHEKKNVINIVNLLSNFIGGVFYVSTTLPGLLKYEKIVEVMDEMYSLLKIIHISQKDINLFKKTKLSMSKYYDFISYLTRKSYEGYVALPFSPDENFFLFVHNLEYFLKIAKERSLGYVK